MEVIDQLDLFSEEVYIPPSSTNIIKELIASFLKYEDTLLNNHVIPLLQGAGVNTDDLKICVRNVYENWMVVEAVTITTCVSMTIWNNGNQNYIHWTSDTITEAFLKHYFHNRPKPAQVFYLEKYLESSVSNFFNYKT